MSPQATPLPTLDTCISLQPVAGVIMMPLCKWGGRDLGQGQPAAKLGLEARAASRAASSWSWLAQEQETHAHLEHRRQLPEGHGLAKALNVHPTACHTSYLGCGRDNTPESKDPVIPSTHWGQGQVQARGSHHRFSATNIFFFT